MRIDILARWWCWRNNICYRHLEEKVTEGSSYEDYDTFCIKCRHDSTTLHYRNKQQRLYQLRKERGWE